MGMSKPVHLLARGAEVEDIVNIAAIAVVDAQEIDRWGQPAEARKPAAVAG
jgi:malate dehydrogenase (oxaloacetate-decarboxylating)(NADP+)